MKRLIALCLAVMMVLSLLAGCSTTPAETTTPTTSAPAQTTQPTTEAPTEEPSNEIVFPLEETMEFTGLSIMANTWYYADNIAWKYALERANIHIELTEVMNAEIKEKGNMLMNGGDYPEMLFKCSALDLDSYGMEGLLLPLEDLIREYAPNLTALLDERDAWDEITAPDGHIYSLPKVGLEQVNIGTGGPIWINQRWLDNVGLDMPTSTEELYEVLKAFKEQDANGNGDPNDEIPFSWAGGTVKIIHGGSLLMEDVLLYSDYFGLSNGEFNFYPATDAFKDDFLPFFTQLFAEGLMDPNSLVQTSSQFNAQGKSGDIIGTFQRSSLSLVPEDCQEDYVALISYNNGGYPMDRGIGKGGIAITDKCENPEVLVAWADWFYTEEGGTLVKFGVEGESYKVNEDGKYVKLQDNFENHGYQATFIGLANPPGLQPAWSFTEVDPPSRTYEQMIDFVRGTALPVLQFTQEEKESVSTLLADIQPYVDNYTAQVISGMLTVEDSWEDYQKTLKDMGLDELVSIYQAAYKRATEN